MLLRKRGRRSRMRQSPTPDASPAERPIDNTGRLRPGQSEPTSVGTLWGRLGRRIGVLLLIAAIAISLVNVLSVSPHVKIEPLTSSQASSAFLRSSGEYQAAADRLLAASVWNSNKITINTGQVSRQLVAEFPELSSASVTLPLLAHRPTVYVQPAQAALVVAAGNGAYVISQDGRALMPSANLPTSANLPQIVDQSGLQISTGRQVLPSDDVDFIQTVLAELAAKHIGVSSMVLPAASRELDVYINGQPYFVKFNLVSGDARQQAGTYLATAAELKRQRATPGHYIDVRVDGRAYYR